jgi:hypothetical protein
MNIFPYNRSYLNLEEPSFEVSFKRDIESNLSGKKAERNFLKRKLKKIELEILELEGMIQ